MRESRSEVRFIYSTAYRNAHSKTPASEQAGPAALRAAAWEMNYWFEITLRKKPHLSKQEAGALYEKRVHERFESGLGPYFRLIYTILHRIRKDNVLTESEKAKYGNLLRSRLQSHEIALAGLNGLSPVSKDFFDLVVEFRLLKYLPEGSRRRILETYYPLEAFQARD